MATYYVNLSLGTDGHAGTVGDPMSFNDILNVVGQNTYYVKGEVTSSTEFGGFAGGDFLPWAGEAELPWKMNLSTSNGISLANGTVEGGIINFPNASEFNINNIKNCIIKGTLLYISDNYNFSVKGSTLILSNGLYTYQETYTDCVLDCSISQLGGQDPVFNNCDCTFADVNPDTSLPFSGSNSQYSWTPPAWPAWNAARTAWATEILLTGVNTPPQPGTPPYAGYETDLWGNARNSIGAGYMLPVSMCYLPITIDHTKVAGNLTDVTIVCTEENFDDTFKTLSIQSPQPDGSDLRFFTSSAMGEEMAFDIVQFNLDADPANSKIEINVKIPSLSSSVDTTIYVRWGTGDTAYAPTDPYGAYNAYRSGFELWCPMIDDTPSTVKDRTSNQYVGSKMIDNRPASGVQVPPYIHTGQYFDSANELYTDISATYLYTFNNSAHTIYRPSGDYLGDGFLDGMRVNISKKSGTALQDTDAINGLRTIDTVTANTITVLSADTLPDGDYEVWIAATDQITFPAFPTGTQFTVFSPFNVTDIPQSWNGIVYNKYWWSNDDGFEYNLLPGNPTSLEIVTKNALTLSGTFNDIFTDNWEALAVNFDGTTVRNFVNGVLETSGTITSVSATSYPYFMLGTTPNHVAPFTGWMDELIIYVGVLSAEEIITMQRNQSDRASFASPGESSVYINVSATECQLSAATLSTFISASVVVYPNAADITAAALDASIYENEVVLPDPVIFNTAAISPAVIIRTTASPAVQAIAKFSVLPPSVVAVVDILVSFVGVPQRGSSPLVVDFTGSVLFGGSATGKYQVRNYNWYFDMEAYPTVYETTTDPTTSHTYTGYYGKAFNVKLRVELDIAA